MKCNQFKIYYFHCSAIHLNILELILKTYHSFQCVRWRVKRCGLMNRTLEILIATIILAIDDMQSCAVVTSALQDWLRILPFIHPIFTKYTFLITLLDAHFLASHFTWNKLYRKRWIKGRILPSFSRHFLIHYVNVFGHWSYAYDHR